MTTQRDIKQANELLQVMTGKKTVDECKVLGKKPQKKKKVDRKHPTEAQEQSAVFTWANMSLGKYPELRLLFAIPNGGSRHILEAVNLKRQGLKAGVPDLFLPVPRKNYSGLWIELKVGKNKTSDSQDWWLDELINQGYRCEVCYGFEEAKNTILEYLEG